MIKKYVVIFVFISLISFGFIVAIPIGILSINFSTYDAINETFSFEYLPEIPSSVERLDLNVDIGDIEIRYVDPLVDYLARIVVDIEMAGSGLEGKNYSDYFNITEGVISGSHIEFSMRLFSNITESEIDSLIKDISITVFLRKDIVFDISASVIEGDVDIEVPFKVFINNIIFNLTNGDIFFNLHKCIIEGNVTGVVDNGKIILISYNTEYTQNSVWTLSSNQNYLDITQHNPLGANVTGSITTALDIGTRLIYNDTVPEVGAKFTLYDYNYPDIDSGTEVNFYWDREPVGINRYSFTSYDFPASDNYILALYLEGILNSDLYST